MGSIQGVGHCTQLETQKSILTSPKTLAPVLHYYLQIAFRRVRVANIDLFAVSALRHFRPAHGHMPLPFLAISNQYSVPLFKNSPLSVPDTLNADGASGMESIFGLERRPEPWSQTNPLPWSCASTRLRLPTMIDIVPAWFEEVDLSEIC